MGALVDIIGKAENGDWQVKVNGNDAIVESDGTFIYEGLDLTPGQHSVTASGLNPSTQETATDTVSIVKLPAEDISYSYDARGNMTSRTGATGTTIYTWDQLNRLLGISLPDGTRQQHHYDAAGRRLKSIENGVERRFVYDGWNVIGERRAGSDDFVSYYTRGIDLGGGIGGIIAVHRNGTPAMYPGGCHTGDYFYHYNHRGDVVSVTDSSGSEVARYRYDAFGNVAEKTGTFESPYGFSTKEYDDASGLIYYGYRYYDPAQGVWLSKDPIGYYDGLNLYSFVTNNPVNMVDPHGLVWWWVPGVVIGGAVGGIGYSITTPPSDWSLVEFIANTGAGAVTGVLISTYGAAALVGSGIGLGSHLLTSDEPNVGGAILNAALGAGLGAGSTYVINMCK
ncbi:MAG: RHS repeat-associated core domain-containing protein [bacterium]|nr:RHS repeat-associated core domain-containing protein [bacterium]